MKRKPYRAYLIGALLIPPASFVVAWTELVVKRMQLGILQFSPAAIGILLLLVLANSFFRKLGKKIALAAHELAIIYSMVLIGVLLTSRGLLEKLIPPLVSLDYFATPENKWQSLFFPHIPQWMVVFNTNGPLKQRVAKDFYEGLFYGQAIPYAQWVKPLAFWFILALAMLGMFLFLANLFRRQWSDNEKLMFPLTQLPVEMMREDTVGPFFRNKLTWIGFSIPAAIFLLNGLHGLFPAIPEIPLQHNLNQYFTNYPWNQMNWTTILFSMAAIGLSYFLPSQLLFSLWFFFFFARLQEVLSGLTRAQVANMPLYGVREFIGYQLVGGYAVLTFYLFYVAWPYFQQAVQKALKGKGSADDSKEMLSYRVSLLGLVVCFAIAVGWMTVAGLTFWVALVEVGVYALVVALIMARSCAEAGMMMTETTFRPVDVIQLFTRRATLGPQNITLLAFLDAVFTRDLRGNLFSTFLDQLKIADGVGMNRRWLLPGILIAIPLTLVVGSWIELYLPYRNAAINMYTYVYQGNNLWTVTDAVPHLEGMVKYNPWNFLFFALGVGFTALLVFMRSRFWWWPFHPLGFVLCGSWTLMVFWFPILVTWVLKSLILRYGGMKAYRHWRPFFLGLILGEFGMAVAWASFSAITKLPAPYFPWP